MNGDGLIIDGRVLQTNSATRGIGTYLRGLLEGLAALGQAQRVRLMLAAGRAVPPEVEQFGLSRGPRVVAVGNRLQPVVDPVLVAASLICRRRVALYHAVEYGQPLLAGVPVVITVHDFIPFLLGSEYRWMRRERLLALHLLRRADAVIAVSQATARDAVSTAGVDERRITVIPHGVGRAFRPAPPERVDAVRRHLSLPRENPYTLSVGVFDAHKRLELLIDVIVRLRRLCATRLVIAGAQNGYEPRIRAAVAAAGLDRSVILAGYVSNDDLVALYSGASCLLVTSAYEGFGLPVLEAMACGAPVVAFANSALSEACGEAGLLVEDGDAQSMAEVAANLVFDQGERSARVDAGLAWAGTFTWERTATETLAVYRNLGLP